MILAQLTRMGSEFRGVLRTATISFPLAVKPNASKSSDVAPDFRLVAKNGADIGAAWRKTAEATGREYLSYRLSTPELKGNLYGAIFFEFTNPESGEVYGPVMVWDPPVQQVAA